MFYNKKLPYITLHKMACYFDCATCRVP